MLKSAVFWAVFAVCCLCGVTRGQPSCVENLFSDVAACFSKEGLDLSLQSGQQDATKLMRETQSMDPSVQCANLAMYKGAISCSLNVLKSCLNTVNMGGSIPDPSNFAKGMDVICERQEDFDSDCLKSHYPHILTCGEETVKAVVRARTDTPTMDEIICLSADVNYDCSKLHLQSCARDTLDIYLEQLNKYQVPASTPLLEDPEDSPTFPAIRLVPLPLSVWAAWLQLPPLPGICFSSTERSSADTSPSFFFFFFF
ncbi:uncharacterized protein LOC143289034 [Babylonia areolata]|uniref:uncharacterized protein LOC143289034 n=1 Tax=Babylonia areolata TaxID=304850 RepID=UPI003FCFF370